MADIGTEIQKAVEAELRNNAAVSSLFGGTTRIFTNKALPDSVFPHIIIGEDQIIGDDTECTEEDEVTINVHVWAREETPEEGVLKAKAIAGAIRRVLRKQLTLTGFTVDDWTYEGTRHLGDPDGATAHSVITFTYLTTAD